ncbi:hypothetical protein MPER_00482, partial [Moniliophthora perniciosa FA553]
VARAGYIPQMFAMLPGPAVVKGLLQKSNAKAFIRHGGVKEVLKDIQEIPVYDPVTSMDDLATPKLVTGTYRWLDALVQKHGGFPNPNQSSRVAIMNW